MLPENLPFATALVLMLLIGVVEAVGFGFAAAEVGGIEGPGDTGQSMLGWLGFGRLPLLMLLVVALAAFALSGLALQHAAVALSGTTLPGLAASGAAAMAALPLTALVSRPLARILPADETSAVSLDDLIGRRGHIVLGTAAYGSPARARVPDAHGQSHYLLVEPHLPNHTLAEGAQLLLVGRTDGHFRAIAVAPHFTLNQGDAA